MKKTIIIMMLLMMTAGCAAKPLAKLQSDPIEIDMTESFYPSSVLTDIQEGTEIVADLDQTTGKMIITLTKGDKTETIETDVTLKYPEYVIQDDIVIDRTKGYDINDFVKAEEGVNIDSSLDAERSILTIDLSKGIWSETIEKQVEVIATLPDGIYVSTEYVNPKYKYHEYVPPEGNYFTGMEKVIVFNDDHTGFEVKYGLGRGPVATVAIPFTWEDDGSINYYNVQSWYGESIGGNGSTAWFVVEDDSLKQYLYEDSYVVFEHRDSYNAPFFMHIFWYEPTYADTKYDFEEVKKNVDLGRYHS